jgi:hypothetical protein
VTCLTLKAVETCDCCEAIATALREGSPIWEGFAFTKRTALMLSLLTFWSVPALSWNGFGHMAVAAK